MSPSGRPNYAAWLLVALALVACGEAQVPTPSPTADPILSLDPDPTPVPSTVAPAPSPTASPSLSPIPSSTQDWGPLAVHDSSAPSMDGLEYGTLVVTDKCVFVDSVTGDRPLVVWPLTPDRWSWDPESLEIVAHDEDGTARYGNGDDIRLGGGHLPSEYLADQLWISSPHPDCVTDTVFFASGEISEPR